MYSNPIALTTVSVPTSHSYELKGMPQANMSIYQDIVNGSLDKPQVLKIAHTTSKVGTVDETRRSVVRFDKTVEATGVGVQPVQAACSAHIVLTIPTKIADLVDIQNVFEQLAEFVKVEANRMKLINGEN